MIFRIKRLFFLDNYSNHFNHTNHGSDYFYQSIISIIAKANHSLNYYRLKSVDKDGSFAYSKLISVQLTIDNYQLSITPNPAKSSVTIRGSHIVSIQVIDNLGRVLKTQNLKDATNPTLSVNGLPVGAYHLQVQTTDGKVNVLGFVKE